MKKEKSSQCRSILGDLGDSLNLTTYSGKMWVFIWVLQTINCFGANRSSAPVSKCSPLGQSWSKPCKTSSAAPNVTWPINMCCSPFLSLSAYMALYTDNWWISLIVLGNLHKATQWTLLHSEVHTGQHNIIKAPCYYCFSYFFELFWVRWRWCPWRFNCTKPTPSHSCQANLKSGPVTNADDGNLLHHCFLYRNHKP